jgi:hypothetical protein
VKFLFGLLVIVALAYAAYTGILAAGTYFEVAQIIDDAVLDLKPGLIDASRQALGGSRSEPAIKLRDAVLAKTTKASLPITEENVVVTEMPDQGMQVKVNWTQPVNFYQDKIAFALPLSVTRSFGPERFGP